MVIRSCLQTHCDVKQQTAQKWLKNSLLAKYEAYLSPKIPIISTTATMQKQWLKIDFGSSAYFRVKTNMDNTESRPVALTQLTTERESIKQTARGSARKFGTPHPNSFRKHPKMPLVTHIHVSKKVYLPPLSSILAKSG